MADGQARTAADIIAEHLTRRRPQRVDNHVDDFRWLLKELGTHGLSGVFLRGTVAVCVPTVGEDGYTPPKRESDNNGPATIRTMTGTGIVTRLAIRYDIHKIVKRKDGTELRVECFFPAAAASHALDALDEAPNLRVLRGVTHTPIVRANGTILDTPGYDDTSGYLYLPTIDVPAVPANPTSEQFAAATTLLRDMISQFTWVGEHDEANYLGLLLTPLLRLLCPPPYKLVAIMARQPGSGKSLLARILRDVHGGVFRSELPHDDPELAKSITSILTGTTAPIVTFDNVTGTFRSSRFAGLLTTATYTDRVLGTTNNTDMINDRLWTITGNNLNLGGDLIRRTVWVTIDPHCPDPHLRTGFKLDLPAYVARHRGEILAALLTLVTAWHAAGAVSERRASDDYAQWSAVVRGILTHAGVPGEFDHLDSAQQKDGEDDEGWGEFITVIRRCFGEDEWTTKQLLDQMVLGEPHHAALVEALPADLHAKYLRNHHDSRGFGISKSLGKRLRDRNGRWANGHVIELAGRDTSNTSLWTVRKPTQGDTEPQRERRSSGRPEVPEVNQVNSAGEIGVLKEQNGHSETETLFDRVGGTSGTSAAPDDLTDDPSPCVKALQRGRE